MKHDIAEFAKFVKKRIGAFMECTSTSPIEYRSLASPEKYNYEILVRASKVCPCFDKNTENKFSTWIGGDIFISRHRVAGELSIGVLFHIQPFNSRGIWIIFYLVVLEFSCLSSIHLLSNKFKPCHKLILQIVKFFQLRSYDDHNSKGMSFELG